MLVPKLGLGTSMDKGSLDSWIKKEVRNISAFRTSPLESMFVNLWAKTRNLDVERVVKVEYHPGLHLPLRGLH